MALKKVESIGVKTQHGDCEIQLLCGDITKLPIEDKVDFIIVSAFPGDYTPFQGTLIGALLHNLGVSVETLAYNREMDLRKHFHCWTSRQLPETIPYNRLVCFERSLRIGVGDIMEQIRTMFRGFVPLFNNQPSTVITPLLGTGDQCHSQKKILETMLEAAYQWITAGLPLKSLQIVIYSSNPEMMSQGESGLIKQFLHYKESIILKAVQQSRKSYNLSKYEVYLSYSTEDQQWAQHVQSSLDGVDSSKIYSERQVIRKQNIFQEHIFKIMIQCYRIIVLLTPEFLDSPDCIEQYNIAMCCNRHSVEHIIAPIYIRTISKMPTYMTLVQYVDCRERKEGDNSNIKVKEACKQLLQSIQEHNTEYDVFISYSHKNPAEAEQIRKTFELNYPDLKVFFDRSDLKTGNLWQKSLYDSLENTRCVLALISPSYLSSAVCLEEYSISLARFIKSHGQIQFVPICIEDIQEVSATVAHVKMVDGREDISATSNKVCKAIHDWLTSGDFDESVLNKPESNWSIGKILQSRRQNHTDRNYSVEAKKVTPLNFEEKEDKLKKVSNLRILMSYGQCDMSNAVYLSYLIKEKLPFVDILLTSSSTTDRFDDLDKANKIVIFLSPEYLSSVTLMEELHLALVRHRSSKVGSLIYIVVTKALTDPPTFIQLLPCYSSCSDSIWEKTTSNIFPKDVSIVVRTIPGYEGSYFVGIKEVLVLKQTMYDILADICDTNSNDNKNTVIENIVKLDMLNRNCDVMESVALSKCLKEQSTEVQSKEDDESGNHPDSNSVKNISSENLQQSSQTPTRSETPVVQTALPIEHTDGGKKSQTVRFIDPEPRSPKVRRNDKSSACTVI